jgi:hypothetical protein
MNRKRCRNVHIYHGDTGECLRGIYQNGSVTEGVFLWMLTDALLIVETGDLQVKAQASQQTISPTSNPLQPGEYDVYSSGTCYFGVPSNT